MSAFPSAWQLLLPNWNATTVIGILAIIIGIIVWKISFTEMMTKISLGAILGGIILIWGISIAQDIISSTLGSLIFWMLVGLGIFAFILFYEPKTKGRRKKR